MIDIDRNIQRLVTELNAFPGVATFSSCGGHPDPSTQSQRSAGEFEVSFNIYPLHGGWRSLELIASVVSECVEHGKLTITVWSMGEEVLSASNWSAAKKLTRTYWQRACQSLERRLTMISRRHE